MEANVIFNSGVVCHAIAIADRMGILDRLENTPSLRFSDLTSEGKYLPRLKSIIRVLCEAEFLDIKQEAIVKGKKFTELLPRKSLFTWLFHASSATFLNTPALIKGEINGLPSRDGALIGTTMSDFGRRCIDQPLLALDVWKSCKCFLDIGCGDATRTSKFSGEFGCPAIGIDASVDAIEKGREILKSAADDIDVELIVADALEMDFDLDLRSRVDVALLALMGHDLLPQENAVKILRSWADKLPNLKTLVVCETVRAEAVEKQLERLDTPSFGYEFLHSLMGINIESDTVWREIFQESGWNLSMVKDIDLPSSTKIYICRR